jgi:aryl sulfotransferase
MVHYDVLKRNMPEEMRRIANFLDIKIREDKWDDMVLHCTFDWMKQNGENSVPMHGHMLEGGVKTFINSGTGGRWKDTLTAEESAAYEAKALVELGPEGADWFATGRGL